MDASMLNEYQKARFYAQEPERATFNNLVLEFRGDNSQYEISLTPEGWQCNCPGFQSHAICPHIMSLEKRLSPLVKREPLPYAPGQNIVSDVDKANRYSEEPNRITMRRFEISFDGDNQEHQITYDDGKWMDSSNFFRDHGISSHTMALERILDGMVEQIHLNQDQAT